MTFFIVGKIEIVNYIQNLSELYPIFHILVGIFKNSSYDCLPDRCVGSNLYLLEFIKYHIIDK